MTRTAGGAQTLEAHYYTDPTLFEREGELRASSWIFAGVRGQLAKPGSFLNVTSGRESALVVRGRDDVLRAFHNVCRHRGTRLCDEQRGEFPGSIACPYHAWVYDYEGRLIAAPTMDEVAGFERDEFPLLEIPVAEQSGLVFVNFDAAAPPLSSCLPGLSERFDRWRLHELEVRGEVRYDVQANWKLTFQNYSECYHCPSAHPRLNRLSPFRDTSNDLEEGAVLGGPMVLADGVESMTTDGTLAAVHLLEKDDAFRRRVAYYTVFPSLFLSPHPDYVLIHRIEPLAVSRTRIVCQWLVAPDADGGSTLSKAVDFWDATNREDWQLCERAHEGISSSGYRPGPYAEIESQLAAFDRHYLAWLDDSGASPVRRPHRVATSGSARRR